MKQSNRKYMKIVQRRSSYIASVILLLAGGFAVAKMVSSNKETAWIYVTLFYGLWLTLTLIFLLRRSDVNELLQVGKNNMWYLVPGLLSISFIPLVFIPNLNVFKLDFLFTANVFICLINPWLEEFYWRGLANRFFKDKPFMSFAISSLGFGLSHPLILGINSPGIKGIPAFIGVSIIGAIWWFCLKKTGSLRGCIITHFFVDVAGMAAYVLANKLVLIELPSL